MIPALVCLALSIGVNNPFQVQRDGDRWWLSGAGKSHFWSFGVDCVDSGEDPAKQKPGNPAFSAQQIWGSEKVWAQHVPSQLSSWGFNTLGGWCDVDEIETSGKPRLPYTIVLHLGAYDLAPWHDLFAPAMGKAMDGAAKAQIPQRSNDPYLIGYFSDNELGWWDDTLFSSYLKLPADSPGRLKLIQLLKSTYRQDLTQLKRDWITDASSFETIKDLKLNPGGAGRLLVKAWTQELAEQYYKLCHDIIRRYDKTHLILGDRYCQYYTLPVVKAAAKYVDVISTNYGADWNNGQIDHFYFDTLHTASGGKPVIVTEFYMCAKQNRSGDRNSSAGFPLVDTQRQRANAFSTYVRAVSSLPYVVGAHWFQYYDEPGKGRGDGENYNMGLIDIYGKPYRELVAASASAHPTACHEKGTVRATFGVAPAPTAPMQGLKDWDKQRGFVKPITSDPIADLYTAWKPNGLYLALDLQDYCDKSLYENGKVPNSERASFRFRLTGMKDPVLVSFGCGSPATIEGSPQIKISEQPGLKDTVILFLPSSLLGRPSMKPGQTITVDAVATSHGRAETVKWNENLRILK